MKKRRGRSRDVGKEWEEEASLRPQPNLTLFIVEDLEAVVVIVSEVHANDDVSKVPERRVEGLDELVVEPDCTRRRVNTGRNVGRHNHLQSPERHQDQAAKRRRKMGGEGGGSYNSSKGRALISCTTHW